MNRNLQSSAANSAEISKAKQGLFLKSEKLLLLHQERKAKQALNRALFETGRHLRYQFNPTRWMKKQPALLLGFAGVLGVAVAYQVSKTKAPEKASQVKHENSAQEVAQQAVAPTLFAGLVMSGFELLKTIFLPVLKQKLFEKLSSQGNSSQHYS